MSDNISVGGWCVVWRHWQKKMEKLSFLVMEGCKIDQVIKAKCNVHIVALYLEGH